MKRIRIILLLILVFPLCLRSQSATKPVILQIDLDAVVHPVSADYVRSGITHAKDIGARAVILRMNTPGGLLESMRDMVGAILDSKVPVITWVGPNGSRAASAGFFLLLAGDVAAMAPGTNAGAAHPVGGQGETIEGVMGKKIEQDFAATIRSLAARNGRNAALAQEAVVQSRSFTADEALAAHLIDLVAPSLPRFLAAIDGRTVKKGEAAIVLHTAAAPVERLEMSPLRRLLGAVADPNIAYLLLTL